MEYNNEKVTETLKVWGERAVVAIDTHYSCARHYTKKHYILGIPAVSLSAIVGSSIFASIGAQPSSRIILGLGFLSVIAALFSAFQTFFRYSERSETHRATASKYSAVKREIEQLLMINDISAKDVERELTSIRKKLDDLSQDSPRIPGSLWEKAREKHGRAVRKE